MPERIGDLTMDELEKLVTRIVDERLKQATGYFQQPAVRRDPELIERLQRHLIEQEPGVPSPTELLQEDRERWRNPS